MLGVYFPLCLTCWMKRGRNPLSITHTFQALKILVSIKSHATTAWICAEELNFSNIRTQEANQIQVLISLPFFFQGFEND